MGDNKQLLLLGNLSPGDDHVFLERIQACINHRNSHGSHSTNALDSIAGEQIKQIVVGPDHIALLFNDHSVGRIAFDVNEVKPPQTTISPEKPVSGGSNNNSGSNISAGTNTDSNAGTSNATAGSNPPPGSSGNPSFASAAVVNANRTAKIRRVMMASRRAGSQFAARGGVIVDRGRALIPASSIPEDLIAQAQVVLQGKSREVIVRELQRTNLNVNEAVNNLLSREDDEEDLEDGADAYLPEELLSLLDAGLRSSEGLMEQEGLYTTGEGYEYLMARELSGVRRRDGRIEPSRKDRPTTETSTTVREKFVFGDAIEYWTGSADDKMPPNVKKFVKIAAFQGELLALTDTGVLYGWRWQRKALGENVPHLINTMFFGNQLTQTEYFTDFETSAYRAVVLTNTGRMGSFVDSRTLGRKIADALFMPLVEVPDGEAVESVHVCPMFAAVRTKSSLYWWGINPFTERRRVFDKHKNKAKKFISTSSSDIKIGAEVRTKSNPVYAANSIAVNLQSSVPMVGVMMESAWSLTETCRFRIYTPEQFDQLKEDLKPKEDKKAMNLSVGNRKRAAPSDDVSSASQPPVKETAWLIKDVFFIHEEPCNDIGVVQIIDGPICGIHFKSYIDEKKKTGDGNDLVVVQGGGRQLSAPVTFERNPQRVFLPHGIRKVISLVVDNSGFRILVEKKGRLHLIRMSTLGKVSSDHMLPISFSAVCGPHDNPEPSKAQLINYGDDNVLLLRDYNGALIPLIRNAIGGYCEPIYLGFTGMQHLSVGVRYLKSNETSSAVISSAPIEKGSKNDTPRTGSKLILIASMITPSPESVQPNLPSLMQLVFYCDVGGVKSFLKKLTEISRNMKEDEFKKFIEQKIIRLRADGNRTILHAAVMQAFARSNANQADVEPSNNEVPGQSLLTLQEALDMTEADAHREKMDRQWKNMIAGAVSDGAKQLAKEAAAAAVKETRDTRSKDDPKPKEVENMEVEDVSSSGKPVSDLKTRQKNSIEILKLFVENGAMQPCLTELLHVRDIHGHTAFISAIQNRAYGAASVLWSSMLKLFKRLPIDDFTNQVYNHAIHSDDSPLFILCYNDTCSFTWTGDEHINQDIFECKTCGLTGSLCCCTECANTCHRNHDCKLKRTSPTAYCDCWEKCSCRALVAGNDTQREYLLRELLRHTDLISQTNSRGEHLLLFLARTVGRQLIEQENFTRRNKNRTNPASSLNAASGGQEIPERDLEPPKFAQRALRICLSEWLAVKSLILVGVKTPNEGNFISEEAFHLQSQNGCTHLDKFVYTLLAKCQEAHLDILLNSFITVANKKGDLRDNKIDYCISRFIRSVTRVFALTTLVAPSTLALTINSAACNADDDAAIKFSTSTGEVSRPPPTRAIAISGIF
uniref:E3 ubiquitin-protein ligase UBR5 n=1 Tax=Panagrolaimus superbus TaxID=310955 RepID=A0A914YMX1_9BILA